ncbi:hypothetical protein J7J83_04645 [bacterium]|nr:hypothetical protein [bacterium]
MKTKILVISAVLGIFMFAGCSTAPGQEQKVEAQSKTVVQPKQEEVKMSTEQAKTKDIVKSESNEIEATESKEVTLAKCLTEKGAKLYTALWCGHCKKQKEAFGDGLEYLDNIDCAEEKGWSQTCKDLDIMGVPTWIFADGTRKTGETSLPDLAKKAGCTY